MIPGEGEKVARAELLCAVVDLPAKAILMNCNQYNGHCGCAVCKAPGEMVSKSVCIPECYVIVQLHRNCLYNFII